jgi:hypothetical protein
MRKINVYNILISKHERNRLLGISRHIWEDNIKMDFRLTWFECSCWIHLVQSRDHWQALVNMVMKRLVSLNVNFVTV